MTTTATPFMFMCVPLATAALMVGVVMAFATAAFMIVAVRVTATAAARLFGMRIEGRCGFQLTGLELGEGFGRGGRFAAIHLDAVALQLEEQARMDFTAQDALDATDQLLADRFGLGPVEHMNGFAIHDHEMLGGAEVGVQGAGEPFRAGDGDAEFHEIAFSTWVKSTGDGPVIAALSTRSSPAGGGGKR